MTLYMMILLMTCAEKQGLAFLFLSTKTAGGPIQCWRMVICIAWYIILPPRGGTGMLLSFLVTTLQCRGKNLLVNTSVLDSCEGRSLVRLACPRLTICIKPNVVSSDIGNVKAPTNIPVTSYHLLWTLAKRGCAESLGSCGTCYSILIYTPKLCFIKTWLPTSFDDVSGCSVSSNIIPRFALDAMEKTST